MSPLPTPRRDPDAEGRKDVRPDEIERGGRVAMLMLTNDDLAELTGNKSAKSQITWLRTRGWVFELNRVGRPKDRP